MFPKIHSGSVFWAPAVNVVTTTLIEGQREREQATRHERRGDRRQGDEAEGLPTVGAEIHGGLHERGLGSPQRASTLL